MASAETHTYPIKISFNVINKVTLELNKKIKTAIIPIQGVP